MKPEPLFIVIFCFALILIILYLVTVQIKKKDKQKIENKIKETISEANIAYSKKPIQMQVETEKNIFLIKIVNFNFRHELILTNKTYWCINSTPKNWKRSEVPNLIKGSKDFLDFQINSTKKVIKVVLLYPDCYNITWHINESDVEVVTYQKAIFGIFFVRFNDLSLFLRK
ncbi:MAG: hypothetical protein KJ971_00785 [Firmicutes bacterium]|nr:hypothetical protein [Bacillota bacterium]